MHDGVFSRSEGGLVRPKSLAVLERDEARSPGARADRASGGRSRSSPVLAAPLLTRGVAPHAKWVEKKFGLAIQELVRCAQNSHADCGPAGVKLIRRSAHSPLLSVRRLQECSDSAKRATSGIGRPASSRPPVLSVAGPVKRGAPGGCTCCPSARGLGPHPACPADATRGPPPVMALGPIPPDGTGLPR